VGTSANDPDPTWGPIPATVWSVIEANAGIICSCLPMLRHPFLRLLGPLVPLNSARSKRQSYQLTSRSNHRASVSSNRKRCTDFQDTSQDTSHRSARDSEERIIGVNGGAETDLAPGLAAPRSIMIRSEVIITRNQGGEEGGQTIRWTPRKAEGVRTYLHI
jgi:hypothetical protein